MKKEIKSIISLITSILPIIFAIWPPEKISSWIASHHRVIYILVLFSIIIGFGLAYMMLQPRKNVYSLRGLKNQNKDLKRYSAIFVDDMFCNPNTLNDFKDRLCNYNILLLPSVSNVRSLIGFDVIILDIIGAGDVLGSTKPLIKEINDICPYKYVVAITSNASDLEDIKDFCRIVPKPLVTDKDFHDKIIIQIQNELRDAFKLLDSPETYWENNIKECIPESERNNVKRKFEHYILDSGLYTRI